MSQEGPRILPTALPPFGQYARFCEMPKARAYDEAAQPLSRAAPSWTVDRLELRFRLSWPRSERPGLGALRDIQAYSGPNNSDTGSTAAWLDEPELAVQEDERQQKH